MKRWLGLFLIVLAVAALPGPAAAQSPITVSASTFTNTFPSAMTFGLEAKSSAVIQSVALIVKLNGIASSSRFVPTFQPGQAVSTKFVWDLTTNSGGGYVPPGVTGEYWWHLEDAGGNKLDTNHQPFRLDDVTQKWKKLENEKVAQYWYLGDDAFGKALFDRANSAISFLEQDLDVKVNRQIQILIYGNRNDFFKSSEPGQAEWTGGRTYSEYGVILMHVETNNLDWGLGATSHELTHAVIHEKIASALGDLSMPHWMDEGLAVYNQTTDHSPDSQFEFPIRRAIQNNTLLTLRSISGNFPADSNVANLAYGESYSAVAFMFKQFGKDKVAQLLQVFKQGATHDASFKQVLGLNIDEFENAWRKDIGAPQRTISVEPTLTPGAAPTFSFSSETTPVPSAGRTPTQVAAVAASPVQPTTAPAGGAAPGGSQGAQPGSGLPGICGGAFGLIGLMLIGALIRRKPRFEE